MYAVPASTGREEVARAAPDLANDTKYTYMLLFRGDGLELLQECQSVYCGWDFTDLLDLLTTYFYNIFFTFVSS